MRRYFCLFLLVILLVLLPLSSFADEILFRNLPWGSNPKVMEKELSKTGFLYPASSESTLLYFDRFLQESDRSYLDNSRITEKNCGWRTVAINLSENGPAVAGYNIMSVEAYYYSPIINSNVNLEKNAAKLYAAAYTLNILDYDLAYEDLVNKLTTLYGAPVNKSGKVSALLNEDDFFFTACDTERCFFYGDNDTVVVLEKTNHEDVGIGLTITYGQIGMDPYISECDNNIKNKDYQERLNNEMNMDRSDNYDGL